MKKIVVVGGLGSVGKGLKVVTAWWKKEGLEPIIFLPEWEDSEGVEPKLTRLSELVDKESRDGRIYLMGISAGASLALNVFIEKLDKIEKFVSVCGRLRMGLSKELIQRKLQEETLRDRAFRESVELLEKRVKKLTKDDKKKILTVSAELGDELIPIQTSQMKKATNILVPTVGHLISITSILTNNFKVVLEFLSSK